MPLISAGEYVRITEKPNVEYREGVLYPKALPTKLHCLIQAALLRLLERQAAQPYPELTLKISPSKFLVPDVAIAPDFPGPYPTEPVTLCCEILSPDDRLGATLAKCEEYHAWGVPYCWIIDPQKRTAWEYSNGGEPIRVTETLHAGQWSVSVAELFASLPA